MPKRKILVSAIHNESKKPKPISQVDYLNNSCNFVLWDKETVDALNVASNATNQFKDILDNPNITKDDFPPTLWEFSNTNYDSDSILSEQWEGKHSRNLHRLFVKIRECLMNKTSNKPALERKMDLLAINLAQVAGFDVNHTGPNI